MFGPDNAALVADGRGGAAGGSVAGPLGAAVQLGDCLLVGSEQLDSQVEAIARLDECPSRVGAGGESVAAVVDPQVEAPP